MRILVAYASKHGATAGIAVRIGDALASAGHDVTVRPVTDVEDLAGFEAVIVGSATYMGHWLKGARAFVRWHQEFLVALPVWLFSSGPLGQEKTDEKGTDLREASAPRELPELMASVQAREHRAFFGVLDPQRLTLPERAMRKLPAGRELFPEGDFRDWQDIEAWAAHIATALDQPNPM